MQEFFHGRRRKTGCVTLMLAVVLAAAWVRSLTTLDAVDLRISPDLLSQESFYSTEGCLGIVYEFQSQNPIDRHSESILVTKLSICSPRWNAYDLKSMNRLPAKSRFDSTMMVWLWTHFRFGAGLEEWKFDGGGHCREVYWMIPYLLVVTPLTLLSAYLLLSKPRSPKQSAAPTASSEPASASPSEQLLPESASG